MLDKNKMDINSYKQEISNIEEEISKLDKEIKQLSEGNTNQLLYEYKQYDKNDEMELISSDNMRDQLQNAFNQVSDFQAQGEHSKVLAGQYSGGLIHLVYIEQDFYLVPKDAKNLQDMCQKDFINSDGKKYRATIEGEKWQFDLGVKAQPDRKKMVYSILTNWNSGSTIPWFKISHDLPNMDLNEATIINKLAQIDAKKKTKERKGEDIKELEKEIKNLQSQIEFKGKEIIQHQKKIQELKKQQELEHTRDQIISLKQFIVDSQSEIEQAQIYIQLNVDGINSEQDHINKKKIELLNLDKQTLHYAILIKCKIEIAHLLREFAKISVDGLGIDKKIIDNNLIPSLEAYSNYYEANIQNIKMLCEETFSNFKKYYQKKQS